ncbi:MAG: ATP-binding cassette domain-containing protein [Planctomycetota bacterium]|nr:ATP-binding cassette domain-containing protein [Planctomycetota bacterium]MDA1211436.1 ATP-binding cassette domain-containing protein [Planctomycetota bacterium]
MNHLHVQCRYRFPDGFALDVEFETSEVVTAICGPSGCGKSTVLSIIAGLIKPNAGMIRCGTHVLVDTKKKICLPPEQRRIGLVLQEHLLFPHLNVRDNLQFGMKRRPPRQFEFARVVEMLELGPLLERRPSTLSGGERQRTALGRAILRGPDLLLMDEPLTALHADLKQRIRDDLSRIIAEYQIPTLLVSHDVEEVAHLAGRVIRLEEGRLAR